MNAAVLLIKLLIFIIKEFDFIIIIVLTIIVFAGVINDCYYRKNGHHTYNLIVPPV